MRMRCRQNILIALILGASCGICVATQLAADDARVISAKEIESELARLEETWKAGKHVEYFGRAGETAERLQKASDAGQAVKMAATLLETMLSRELRPGEAADYLLADENNFHESCYSDLSAISELACFILDQDTHVADADPSALASENGMRHAMLLAGSLGRVRKEIIPNYKEKPVSLNVAPPADTGEFSYSGMDPNDVKDPVARRKWLDAIRENILNGVSNSRQQEARGMEPSLGRNILDYLFDTFDAIADRKGSSAVLAKCVKEARLTDKEWEELKGRLTSAKAASKGSRERDAAADRESQEKR